jgi:NSS family neurotransmitter:Na+ symporter
MSTGETTDRWPNSWVFILAAVGSAAGLGNIWRFPFLAFEHGGAAFVLVLIVATIIVGLPLLTLETGLGQKANLAAPGAFGSIQKPLRLLGWTALVFSFFVIAYYMSVLGWGIDYFAASFDQLWTGGTSDYFFDTVLGLQDSIGQISGFSWPVLAGFLISWVLVYFSVWKGVESVSKVVVWTATLPIALLVMLIIRAVTLPGAGAGLELFFLPQWSALADPQLWLAAFSQVFFSLSLAFGIMIAYGSYNEDAAPVFENAVWILIGNLVVSILAGVAVFGTLGHMAAVQNTAIADVVAGGPSLVFVVLPEAISLLPAASSLFALAFFGTIIMLGVDSAFSILEGIAAGFRDAFPDISTKRVTLILSGVALLAGLPFVTDVGLYLLDILDHFTINYGLVAIGAVEAGLVGWLYADELRDYINKRSGWQLGSLWEIAIKYVIPVFLTALFVVNAYQELQEPYGGYPVWAIIVVGVVPILLAPAIAYAVDYYTFQNTDETAIEA